MGFLFGLAPSGVCPASIVTDAAVRSYRTFSPLPIIPSIQRSKIQGGIFSVALSVGSHRPGVTWRSARGARTFLPLSCLKHQRAIARSTLYLIANFTRLDSIYFSVWRTSRAILLSSSSCQNTGNVFELRPKSGACTYNL